MKTSIKSLATVALLSVLALIAGCGGGGAQDPFATTPVPRLTVGPAELNVYAGVPAVVTITSGVGPFQVFSSDSVVLPVTQLVAGAAITLTATNVDTQKAVTLTIRDAAGQSSSVSVTVFPSALLSAFAITPTSNTTCSGVPATALNRAAICSGESGLASITARSAGAVVLPNRQIRFDVLQGAYNFVLDQAGTTLAKAQTVLTDQNGQASVTIRTEAAAASQAGLVRATDVTSGNRVDGAFTIVQAVEGKGVLSAVPPSWTVTGFYQNECASAGVDYVIYGGLAPYVITNAAPNFFSLSANGVSSPTSVVVPQAGGRFTVFSGYNANCTGFEAPIVITDASGRAITVTYVAKTGTATRADTQIAPKDIKVTATGTAPNQVCGGTYYYAAATGFEPLTWSISVSSAVATLNRNFGNSVSVTIVNMRAGDVVTIVAIDGNQKLVTATLSCVAPTA